MEQLNLYTAVEVLKSSTTDNTEAVTTLRQVEKEDGTTKLVYCCGGAQELNHR